MTAGGDAPGDVVVVDETGSSRFEIRVGGRTVGFADYELVGDTMVLPHTVVDRSMRGRGVAATLVRHALDTARAQGRTVEPRCWYVARFIDEHPDYGDLVAPR